MDPTVVALIGTFARAALTVIGGALVSKGVIEADGAATFVEQGVGLIGSIMAASGVIWGVIQKFTQKKEVKAAAATGVDTTVKQPKEVTDEKV